MAHVTTYVSHGLLNRCSEVRLGGRTDDHVVLVKAVDVHRAGCLAGLQGHLLNARLRNVPVKVRTLLLWIPGLATASHLLLHLLLLLVCIRVEVIVINWLDRLTLLSLIHI